MLDGLIAAAAKKAIRSGNAGRSRFRSGRLDGRQIKGCPGIEDEAPFRVTATFTLKRSVFETRPGDRVVRFDHGQAHIAAAHKTLHGRPPEHEPPAELPTGSCCFRIL
jgi:hypothetical protein